MWVGLVVYFGVLSKGVRFHLVTVGLFRLLDTSSCHLSGSPTQELLRTGGSLVNEAGFCSDGNRTTRRYAL